MPVEEEKETAQEEVVYREVIRFGGLLLFLLLGLVVLYAVLFAAFLVAKNRFVSIVFLILIIFMVLVFLNFWRLSFEITETRVRIRFGVLVKSVNRSDIKSCEPYELSFTNYLGYGIRYGADGTKAYNTRNGPGVKMVVDGERRPLVVSVDDPEKVCLLLAVRGEPMSS